MADFFLATCRSRRVLSEKYMLHGVFSSEIGEIGIKKNLISLKYGDFMNFYAIFDLIIVSIHL